MARFLSFATAPCVHIQRCDDLQRHIGWRLMAGAGGVLMGADDRAIDADRPVLAFGYVGSAAQFIEELPVGPIA